MLSLFLSARLVLRFDTWNYWAPDMDFEIRKHSSARCMFIGWHNVEAFALPPQQRSAIYGRHLFRWPPYKSCRL